MLHLWPQYKKISEEFLPSICFNYWDIFQNVSPKTYKAWTFSQEMLKGFVLLFTEPAHLIDTIRVYFTLHVIEIVLARY